MRYSSILVLAVLFPALASADPVYAVRALDARASAAIAQAQRCSSIIRDLLEELEQSNLIVHVETSWNLPTALAGATHFVASRGGYRFVRVRLAARLSARARMVTLGHELQHAIEIARSNAYNHRDVRRLLDESGYTLGGRFYETDSARRVEQRIRMER